MRTRFSGTDPIIDTLPPGVQFVPASSDQGTCTAESGRPVTCVVVVEEPGTATVTIVVIPTQCGDYHEYCAGYSVSQSVSCPGRFSTSHSYGILHRTLHVSHSSHCS